VFDESTSGLDPRQVIAVRNLIRELGGQQTVLIASHLLSEIEQIASRVILLDGKLLTTDALQQGARTQQLRLRISGPEPDVRSCIATIPGVRSVSPASSALQTNIWWKQSVVRSSGSVR
jgi:ABC-2 type transport system ATP-binding protein